MAQINQLPTRTLQAGDVFPFFSSNNGDAAKAPMTALAALVQSINESGVIAESTRFAALREAAQVIDVSDATNSIWLIINSDGDYTATIKLPEANQSLDKKEVSILISGGDITTVTMQSFGATFAGDLPTALLDGERYTLKYESVMKTWYLVNTAAPMHMPANPYL